MRWKSGSTVVLVAGTMMPMRLRIATMTLLGSLQGQYTIARAA